jgi:hypothetical protein
MAPVQRPLNGPTPTCLLTCHNLPCLCLRNILSRHIIYPETSARSAGWSSQVLGFIDGLLQVRQCTHWMLDQACLESSSHWTYQVM